MVYCPVSNKNFYLNKILFPYLLRLGKHVSFDFCRDVSSFTVLHNVNQVQKKS